MSSRFVPIAVLLAASLLAPTAGATPSNHIEVPTGSGTIVLDSEVVDDFQGDPGLRAFVYSLSGNYDPMPGMTNGISSLQIFFGALLDIADQTSPGGWIANSTGAAPPFGAGWDLPNSLGDGVGAGPTGAVFSFVVPAGTPYTDAPEGSYAASSFLDSPFAPVELIDPTSGEGPLVPVPEPGSAPLLAAGAALLAGARRRS